MIEKSDRLKHKYLGVMIDNMLSRKDHIDALCQRTKQRIYFLRRLRSFRVRKQISVSVISVMSVQQYCNSIWYQSLPVMLKTKLFNQLKICSRIVGQPLEKLYDSAYNNLRLANNNIVSDLNHVLHNKFELLPSSRRYRVPRLNKVRLKHSFVHQAILELNNLI